AVFRITLNGFDTHQNQPGIQAGLLAQLAEGLAALRAALVELGRWDRTLILTYAEFGRRPAENG
ncbi:MAG: Twin-arginine translocation pathway signal sequence domain-containing protein, partial [Rhodocyclales bacterium CG17_big_fil_post_rev_8_21_14_2_50_68_7]